MSSNSPRFRRLLCAGFILALLTCFAFHGKRNSTPATPAAAAQPPGGFVCRSPHYILTAEIHAGS